MQLQHQQQEQQRHKEQYANRLRYRAVLGCSACDQDAITAIPRVGKTLLEPGLSKHLEVVEEVEGLGQGVEVGAGVAEDGDVAEAAPHRTQRLPNVSLASETLIVFTLPSNWIFSHNC